MLEEVRINRWLTHLWAIVMVPAAQLVRPKGLAPTLTRHHRTVTLRYTVLQRRRTRRKQIHSTAYHGAHAFTLVWGHRHGDVEAVHEANAVGGVVVRTMVDAELSQRRRSCAAGTVTL